MPKLSHPDSKQTIEVSDDMAEAYRSQGWQDAKPAKRQSE